MTAAFPTTVPGGTHVFLLRTQAHPNFSEDDSRSRQDR